MNRSTILFLIIILGFTAVGYGLVEVFVNVSPLPVYGKEGHKVNHFTLTDQLGEEFNSEDYEGKIWIVNSFFASCPIVCPKVMKNLQEVHDYIRNDESIITLSVTVDPKRDTPEQLLNYARKYNANNETWRLLTGEKKSIYRLARVEFLMAASDSSGDNYDFIHSENINIIDPDLRIRDIINGTDPKADQKILESIKKLRREYKI